MHQPLPGKVYAQQNTLSLPGNAIWASGKFSSKLQNQVFGQLKSKLQLNPVNFGHNNFFLIDQFVTICSTDPQQVSKTPYWQYLSEIVFENLLV